MHRFPTRGQVRQPSALELGDGLLNDGVPAVVGLSHRQGSVGNERVVVPGREQRQLRAWGRADPAHHQADLPGVLAITREDGKRCLGGVGAGHLRRPQPVRDRLPRAVGDLLDRGPDRLVLPAVIEKRTSNFTAVPITALA